MAALSAAPRPQRIELMVRNVNALFNSMDPSPFREKDLNPDAEAFIVGSARQYAPGTALILTVHLQESPADTDREVLTEAIHNFFEYEKELTVMEFRRLMREGRVSLMVGLAFLFACLLAQHYLLSDQEGPFPSLVRESLIIAGWVGMWQPIQTYLYDWWPLRRRRRIFDQLSRVPVEWVFAQTVASSNLKRRHEEAVLDQALADSFPASDPVSSLAYDSPIQAEYPRT